MMPVRAVTSVALSSCRLHVVQQAQENLFAQFLLVLDGFPSPVGALTHIEFRAQVTGGFVNNNNIICLFFFFL